MYTLALILYLIVCFALTIVILLQSSKGGGLAGAFGGGGNMGAVFGGRGAATFLSRVTTVLAVTFMLLALVLSFSKRGDTSGLIEKARQTQETELPGAGLPIVPTEDTQLPLTAEPAPAPADSGQ